jgi:hypothetical protein
MHGEVPQGAAGRALVTPGRVSRSNARIFAACPAPHPKARGGRLHDRPHDRPSTGAGRRVQPAAMHLCAGARRKRVAERLCSDTIF